MVVRTRRISRNGRIKVRPNTESLTSWISRWKRRRYLRPRRRWRSQPSRVNQRRTLTGKNCQHSSIKKFTVTQRLILQNFTNSLIFFLIWSSLQSFNQHITTKASNISFSLNNVFNIEIKKIGIPVWELMHWTLSSHPTSLIRKLYWLIDWFLNAVKIITGERQYFL